MRMSLLAPVLPALAVLLPVPAAAHGAAVKMGRCEAITLTLRPGIHPVLAMPGPAGYVAPDSPRVRVPVSLPLYPGAAPLASKIAGPYFDVPSDPYLHTASAEYRISAGQHRVKAWVKRVFTACGWHEDGHWTTNASQFTSGDDFISDRNPQLSVEVSFAADPAGGTDFGYGVEEIILPPRPAASYLHGPFVAVRIAFGQVDVTQRGYSLHVAHTTLLDRVAIHRLVTAINALREYRDYPSAIPCAGGGGPATGPFWLSFVRPNGSVVHAYADGPGYAACGGGLAVNGVRWLMGAGGVWHQLLNLAGGRG